MKIGAATTLIKTRHQVTFPSSGILSRKPTPATKYSIIRTMVARFDGFSTYLVKMQAKCFEFWGWDIYIFVRKASASAIHLMRPKYNRPYVLFNFKAFHRIRPNILLPSQWWELGVFRKRRMGTHDTLGKE